MSSRSGGGNGKKAAFAGVTAAAEKEGKRQSLMETDRKDAGFDPLESRLIEIRDQSTGAIKEVPALDKRWVPSMKHMEFYLPSCEALVKDQSVILQWLDSMEMYSKDLMWLLSLPHHMFWSVMIYSPEVPQVVLQSFILRAPVWYDKEFPIYLEHELIGPKYQEVYSLMFRVFMRLCTFKESKKDFITPVTWASLIADQKILDVAKLQTLCILYDSEDNKLLPKMIDNVMKHCPKLVNSFRTLVPVILSQSDDKTKEFRDHIRASAATNNWDLEEYDEILSYFLSTTCGLYKFSKLYPPAADMLHAFPNVMLKLAMSYEPNCCTMWNQVITHLPILEERVMLLRILLIRLFRIILAGPTIDAVTSPNDPKMDKYLEVLTNCLDEKTFIRDYEKLYPFKQDVNSLLSRGVFIDETTIDYVANAISACFHACGEEYAVEKLVVDPLYDPNFDRQLLGACSLDVTGVELQSLVTQVKDILPDLPDSYVEVVLKHYGYQAEAAINALLEGSVPGRLEKYKKESYVQPLKNPSVHEKVGGDDTELERMASKLKIRDVDLDGERFYSGKRRYGFDDDAPTSSYMANSQEMSELKPLIKGIIAKGDGDSAPTKQYAVSSSKKSVKIVEPAKNEPSYVDENLLPQIGSYNHYDYEDEYDDTYDAHNVGMTEPDTLECQPLNQKLRGRNDNDADDEEDEDEKDDQKKKLDFCEDPAIVRARLEAKRAEKHHNNRRGPPPPSSHDVVGKAKGQGQEREVLYARRQKNINKDPGNFKKKRADFKRKEF